MFNLIAQYIGYSNEVTVEAKETSNDLNCVLGETEVAGDWMLVDVQDENGNEEEEFHRVPSPAPVLSLHNSMVEDVKLDVPPTAVSHVGIRRVQKCLKNPKRQHARNSNLTQHRPNQMKRANMVLGNRSQKVFQKMRQIVHQPRKF